MSYSIKSLSAYIHYHTTYKLILTTWIWIKTFHVFNINCFCCWQLYLTKMYAHWSHHPLINCKYRYTGDFKNIYIYFCSEFDTPCRCELKHHVTQIVQWCQSRVNNGLFPTYLLSTINVCTSFIVSWSF